MKYSLENISNEKIYDVQPVFSHDSLFLFIACGNQLHTYSVFSGICIHTNKSHNSPITFMQLNQANQLISSDSAGNIIVWSHHENKLINEYKLGEMIHSFVIIQENSFSCSETIKLSLIINKNERFYLKTVELSANASFKYGQQMELEGHVHILTVLQNTRYLVLASRRTIRVIDCDSLSVISRLKSNKVDTICCVRSHPVIRDSIAVAFESGKIEIFSNVAEKSKYSRCNLSWHVRGKTSVAFAANGLYLISGGSECVMVKWKVDHYTNDFLPRLSAPIRQITIAPDSHNICLLQSDNTILMVDSNKIVKHSVNSFFRQWLKEGREDYTNWHYPVGLVPGYDESTLMTNGPIGSLQFLTAENCKPLFQFDVVRQNYIVATDNETESDFPDVTAAVFVGGCGNEQWLVTAEFAHQTLESQIKFWHFDETTKDFVLCYSVEESQPIRQLVNLSADKGVCALFSTCIKIWKIDSENNWVCYKELDCQFPILSMRASADSSVILALFSKPHLDQIITWDTLEFSILPSINCISKYSRIRQIEFCGGRSQRLLVCVTKELNVLIVDILKDEIYSSILDNNVTFVATNKKFDFFAMFQSNGNVELVNTLTCARSILAVNVKIHTAAIFMSDRYDWSIVFIDDEQNLKTIHPLDSSGDTTMSVENTFLSEKTSLGALSVYMKGEENYKPIKKINIMSHHDETHFSDYMMTFASHMLPPVDVICDQYFKSLLKLNK